MVDGILLEQGREPQLCQVVVQERKVTAQRTQLFMLDNAGVFQQTEPLFAELTAQESRPDDGELPRVRTELEEARRRLQETQERLRELQGQMQREKEIAQMLWRQNCQRLADMDSALANREAEVAALRTHLNQPQAIRVREAEPDPSRAAPHEHSLSSSPSSEHSVSSEHSLSVSSLSLLQLSSQPARAHVDTGRLRQSRGVSPEPVEQLEPREQPEPARGRGRRRGPAPPVEPFSGENQEVQLDDWLPTLERAGQWNEWTKEELLMQLAGHLRGRALQEWNLVSQEDRSSWDDAVRTLRSRLEPGIRTLAAQDFRHTAQGDGEAVSDFI